MVLKRKDVCGGEEERKREFKRKYGIPRFCASVNRTSPQELGSILEPFIRNIVREEIEFALRNRQRPSLIATTSSGSRLLQLSFDNKLPSTIFTGCKVESEDICPLKVVLRDNSGRIITSGPLSSAKLALVVLEGDLNPDDYEDLTAQEFNKRTVREREGRKPLVIGTRSLTLRQGVGYLNEIVFTDNSSWIRCGKFRLGVKVQHNNSSEIKEGISNSFKVKDQRGESYKKNHPPSLIDEVWRLEKIAKFGASHKRLALHGIFTVRDFLRLYYMDSHFLRQILGTKPSSKAFDTIVGHAKECTEDDEHYEYRGDDGTTLILSSTYQVVGVIFDGQNVPCPDELDQSQKRLVETLKRTMYNNLNHLVPLPLGGQSFLTSPVQSSSLPASCFSAPSIMPQNFNFTANQDEVEMQMNSCPAVMSSIHAHGFQDELQVSDTETSPQLGECSNPTFSDEFIVDDSCTGNQSLGYDWDAGFSLGSLDSTAPHVVNDNFQVDSPVWQGNGFFLSPGNEAPGLMASNFDFRISRNLIYGRSKVCWCKIRAVVKWRMIKSRGKKNGKAWKYKY